MSRYAADHDITLALQNHPPVIQGYRDVLRATREIGPLQALNHYGNEYDEVNGRITRKFEELAAPQVAGLLDIGYSGYMGFELCHTLPLEGGHTVGIEFVDKNARLAAKSMRELVAEAKKRQA